jgi:hypothetical protein
MIDQTWIIHVYLFAQKNDAPGGEHHFLYIYYSKRGVCEPLNNFNYISFLKKINEKIVNNLTNFRGFIRNFFEPFGEYYKPK